MDDQELRRPLWQYPLRWLAFEDLRLRWSYLSESERAARGASWSARRRAVKPIGLVLYWAGVVWSIIGDTTMTVRVVWLMTLVSLALIGVRDWMRDGVAQPERKAREHLS